MNLPPGDPPSLLHRFLGLRRWNELFSLLKLETSTPQSPRVGMPVVVLTLLLALTPVLVSTIAPTPDIDALDVSTFAFGICTLLAILLRRKLGFREDTRIDWNAALRVTHTAFALGCIPVVLILALNPSMFVERKDILSVTLTPMSPDAPLTLFMIGEILALLVLIAAWAAITEEYIFRGLLVSVLRRWHFLPKQWQRDVLACGASALLFGFAHYATWGFMPALALSGLGVGLVTAYIANGERLLPLIIYHFAFDILSMLLVALSQ